MKRTLIALCLASILSTPAHAIMACASGDEGIQWYVGQPLPALAVTDLNTVSCYADGAELAYVAAAFPGLPTRTGAQSLIWRGAAAAFILDNLVGD